MVHAVTEKLAVPPQRRMTKDAGLGKVHGWCLGNI